MMRERVIGLLLAAVASGGGAIRAARPSAPARGAGRFTHTVSDACPLRRGDTARYSEWIRDTIRITTEDGDRISTAGLQGTLAVTLGATGGSAWYEWIETAGTGESDSTNGSSGHVTTRPEPFRFAPLDCGGDRSLNAPVFDSALPGSGELPYHLDGFLITGPANVPLDQGAHWDDTLARSDSGSERRSASISRHFEVIGDTMRGGVPVAVVSIRTQATIVRVEGGGDDATRIVLSREARGVALIGRDSRLMVSRTETAETRVTATAGSRRLSEASVVSIWRLALVSR